LRMQGAVVQPKVAPVLLQDMQVFPDLIKGWKHLRIGALSPSVARIANRFAGFEMLKNGGSQDLYSGANLG